MGLIYNRPQWAESEFIMNYYTQLLLENIDNRADKLLKTGYENGWSIDRFIFEFGMFQRAVEDIMTSALGQDVISYYRTLFIKDVTPIHTMKHVSYSSPCITFIDEWHDYNEIPVGRHFSTVFGDVVVNRQSVKTF